MRVQVTTRLCCQRIFSYELLNARKEKKIEYRRATYKKRIRFAVEFFLSYKLLKSRKRKIFLPTSYIQGQVRESEGSCWVRQGWSITTKRGCDKVKKKKRKEKDQGRREGGSSEGNVPCVLHQENLFFGSRLSGLKYWLLRDLAYEEARCKRSSGNGLLNAAKAVP